ncbi:MAG: HTH domain-containing protein, partial [Bacillota bacterium]|nr:HTH domain-containing protein [Bacillota bacterium]
MGRKRVERLEQVRELVLSKGAVTAQEIANILGTSRRTIYRYVESLRESGFAIEACPGSTGGLRVSSAEKSRGLMLTDEESMAILLAGSAVSQNSFLPYNDSLDSALEKIRRSLSKAAWADIQETMPNVSVMVDKLSDCLEVDSLLEEVTEAIAHKRGIAITYYSLHRDAYNERQIDPYHLF